MTMHHEISAHRSLMPAAVDGSSLLPIPCPRQGSEGGRSRPLDHMRQIPFVRAPLLKLRFSRIFLSQCTHSACARAKIDLMTECTANRLLLPLFHSSPKTIAPGIVKVPMK